MQKIVLLFQEVYKTTAFGGYAGTHQPARDNAHCWAAAGGQDDASDASERCFAATGQKTLFLNLDFETDYYYLESQEKLLQKVRLDFGYPRIVVEEQGQEKLLLMNEIYESYLKKDIVYFLKLDRPDVFTRFIRLCAHLCGSIINYNTLASDSGLSVPTVKKYLWYAEQTFVIKTVSPFFRNKRKEIKKSPTLYFTDVGLRNFALRQMGQDVSAINAGRLFQNLIYLILGDVLRKSMHSIHYWRTSDLAEVDFVIVGGPKPIPLEITYSHLKTPKMTRSLRSFIDTYKPDIAYVVNLSYQDQKRIDETEVRFVPYYELYRERYQVG